MNLTKPVASDSSSVDVQPGASRCLFVSRQMVPHKSAPDAGSQDPKCCRAALPGLYPALPEAMFLLSDQYPIKSQLCDVHAFRFSSHLRALASALQEAPQFPPVAFRTYPTAHDLYDMDEQNDALHWFLGLGGDAAGATDVLNGGQRRSWQRSMLLQLGGSAAHG